MFQFYCNHCFRRQKYETDLQLFVSRCGHLLCTDCIQENCAVCGRPFKAVAINKDMPPPMAEYFSNPMRQYQHYKKVMKFHHEQEKRLVIHLCHSNAEDNKRLRSEIQGYTRLNDSIKRQIQREKERIRKLREYIAFHDRRLEQACCMNPPIIPQPRPRYPPRCRSVENAPSNPINNNAAKRFSQQIRANIIFPNSPTLSGNNSSLATTERTPAVTPVAKKQRTPPPLLPFSQHRLLNPQFSFNSSTE